jgi:tetratricopeptide (TPR) repeat protein
MNQAQAHLRLKRPAEAEALALRALRIAESTYGPVHPLVADAVLVYGETLQATKRKAEAKKVLERALAIQQENAHRSPGSATVHISDLLGKP